MMSIVLVVLGVIGMTTAMVIMSLEEDRNKEVSVEQELTKQATKIAGVMAQLDAINGKVGR